MKVFHYLFLLSFCLPVLLFAQAPASLSYTMKLTRVYCDIPINQDERGPDPRYLINARLVGLGTTTATTTFVELDDIQTTGWIDIVDQIIGAGTLDEDDQRVIDLCNSGIGVIFDDLDAWEEDAGNSNTRDFGDDFPLQLTNNGGITGRPESLLGSNQPRTFIIDGALIDPGSPFKFEFSVEYTLENAIQRVALTGNIDGEPVADICQGGAAYIQAVLDDNFSGGYVDYERSTDGGNSWTFLGRRPISQSLPISLNSPGSEQFQATLSVCMKDVSSTAVSFTTLDVMPSILSSDINVSYDSPCPGEPSGTITLTSINNLRPEDKFRIQLRPSSGIVENYLPIDNPILPFEFSDISRGSYNIILTRLTLDTAGSILPACSIFSENIRIINADAPLITTSGTRDTNCEQITGSVFAAGGNNNFGSRVTIMLYHEDDPLTPIAEVMNLPSFTVHEFTGLNPGTYFFTLDDGGRCPQVSEELTIFPALNRASGTFAPTAGGSLTLNCADETVLVDFAPDAGTGTNQVVLRKLGALPDGGDSQLFLQNISEGGTYTAQLDVGDYVVTFSRFDQPYCSRAYTFSVTSPNPPITIITDGLVAPTDCDPDSGSATVYVSGGAPGYTPTITGGIEPASSTPLADGSVRYTFMGLSGGDYTLNVTDASGCQASLSLPIPTPPAVSVMADPANSKLVLDCKGDTDGRIQLTGTGVGLTYRFTPPGGTPGTFGTQTLFENLLPGTYLAEVMDQAGCPASQLIEITEPEELEIFDVSYSTRYQCGLPLVDFRIRFSGVPDVGYCSGDATPCAFSIILRDGDPAQSIPLSSTQVSMLTGPDAPVQELLLRDQAPGDYAFQLATVRFNPNGMITCPSNVLPVAAVPPPPLFVEVLGKTDPPCFGEFSGAITVRYGGGDPEETFKLDVYAAEAPTDISVPEVIRFRLNLPYSLDTTLTIDGLPDPQNSRVGASSGTVPSDLYYFARITPSIFYPNGTECTVQSHPPNPAPDDLLQLISPDPMSFEAAFTKGLECDDSGAILTVSNATGGTPPYRFSVVRRIFEFEVPENEVIYDFSPQTSFEIFGQDDYFVEMLDANDCLFSLPQGLRPDYDPMRDYALSFTQTLLAPEECPPNPADPLRGLLQLKGGLGETVFTFSTMTPGGSVIPVPAAITTSDSIILLEDFVPGTVTVQLSNFATGQDCQSFTFEVEALPDPLEATVEINQGETCLGAEDGQVRLRVSGGVEPITFFYNGISTQIPAGQPAVLDIQDLQSGTLLVGIEDGNECYIQETIEIAPSLGAISVEIFTTDESPCQGAGNGTITLNLNGGTGPYQFDWLDDDPGPISVPQNGTVFRDQLTRREYEYRIVDANGCEREGSASPGGRDSILAQIIDIVQPGCGIEGSFTVEIVENSFPASASFTVSINGGAPQSELTFTGLDEGMYNVQVLDDGGCGPTNPLRVELIREDGNLTAISVPTAPTCNGGDDGQILVTPDGGVGPYNFSLNGEMAVSGNTFTGLEAGMYSILITDAEACSTTITEEVPDAAGITADAIPFAPSCNGAGNGSLTITATSGVAPFQYRLAGSPYQDDNDFPDLLSGPYQFSVRDLRGCESPLETVFVPEGPLFEATIIETQAASCDGGDGAASLSVSFGTPPYTFSWPGGQSGPEQTTLDAGTYIVTVTDAGPCTTTISVTIDLLGGPAISVSSTEDEICGEANGSITVSATGGTEPYNYSWSDDGTRTGPTATMLSAGPYTIIVTDAGGCSDQTTVTIGGSVPISVNLLSSTPSSCGAANGTATVTTIGGLEPIMYSWSHDASVTGPTATNLPSGETTVTVSSANGCSDQLTITITDIPGIQSVNGTVTGTSCGLDNGVISATPEGGNGPFTYAWSHSMTLSSSIATDLAAGEYTLTITDNDACSQEATFSISTSSAAAPLMASNLINTSCGEDNGSLTVVPDGGVPPFSYNWADFPPGTEATVSNLAAGDYALTVTDGNGCPASGSFTIQGSNPVSVTVASQTNPSGGMTNGSISITTAGFVAPLQYDWSHDDTLDGPIAENLGADSYTVIVTDINNCSAQVTVVLNNGLLAEIVGLADALCTDGTGTAAVNITVGTPPFTYQWSHAPGQNVASFDDLDAGDYSVIVGETAGAMLTLDFTIDFIPGPTEITVSSNIGTSCGLSNGSLEVAANGGTAPYTYEWAHDDMLDNGTATNLAAGTYEVTITDANLCAVADVFTIDGSTTPTLSVVSQTAPSCGEDNGAITVLASGLTGTLTYVWSHDTNLNDPMATDLAPGDYTIDVTDANGCTASVMLTLTGQDALVTSLSERSDAICEDGTGSAMITVSSGTEPFFFEWSHAPGENVDNFSDLAAGDYSVTIRDVNGCTDVQTFSINFIAGPASVTVISQQATTCGEDNGSLEVAPEGGTGPYTFAWSHDDELEDGVATGLAAGDYEVTITDANDCPVADVFTIDGSATPTLSVVSQTDPSCGEDNGAITVLASGLTGTLTYVWSHDANLNDPMATDLAPGDYTIDVTDANGCTASVMLTLTGQDALVTSLNERSDAICEDGTGSATITVSSGTEPFFFEWSHAPGENVDNFSDLAAGDYSVTIRDVNGCTDVQTFSIDFIAGPASVTVISQQATTCGEDNGSLEVAPEGGTGPYTFAWSHDDELEDGVATGLAAGDYEVTITDANDCPVAEVFTIDGSATPTLSVASQTDPSCGEDNGAITVLASGLTGTLTYVWSHDTNLNDPMATDLAPGDYTIDVTDANGCTASVMLTLTGQDALVTSLNERSDAICEDGTGSATITVSSGTEPFFFEWSHAPGENVDNFSDLAAGDYSVTIRDVNGCTDVQTFSIDFIAGPASVTVISQQATTCGEDNGSLEVAPEGGTGPYTFAWSHDDELEDGVATGLAAGDYEVTITDANDCPVADVFTIDGSATPTLSVASQTDPSCGEDNGQITVLAEGLTEPLDYNWSHDNTLEEPTANNLPPGDYSIEVIDDNGCVAGVMLTLTGQEALTTSLTELSDAICEEDSGSATIAVTSGTEPFSFEWSHAPGENVDNFQNLTAGDYGVTITDANGCFEIQVFQIEFINGPAGVSLINQQSTNCGENNGRLEVAPDGGTGPFIFEWSHDEELDNGLAIGLAPGQYEVTITDVNGCPVADVYTIDDSEIPAVTVEEIIDANCGENNGSILVSVSGLTGSPTYEWGHDTDLDGPLAEGLGSGNYSVTITGTGGCRAEATASVSSQDGPSISLAAVSADTCGAETGTIAISYDGGGTAPFTYRWSHDDDLTTDTATGLSAGTYGITITDTTGCVDALTGTVETEVTPLLPEFTLAPATCAQNDGQATVEPQGGRGPYFFFWSHDSELSGPEATNVPEGNHSVTIIDQNGCTETADFQIIGSEGPENVELVSVTPTTCGEANGSLEVMALGGTAPYTFRWPHDPELEGSMASDLPAGTYSVILTDANSCMISADFVVAPSETPEGIISELRQPTCEEDNGSIEVSATGLTAPLFYVWSHDETLEGPLAEGLAAGDYSVIITGSNDCSATVSASLEAIEGLSANAVDLVNTRCEDGNGEATIAVLTGDAPFSYNWSQAPGENVASFSNLAAGDFSVTVTDANGCTAVVDFSIGLDTGPTAVDILNQEDTRCGEDNGSINISPVGGLAPYTFAWADFPGESSGLLTDLPAGDYALTIRDANNCAFNQTFTIGESEAPTVTLLNQSPSSCTAADGSATVSTSGFSEGLTFSWSHDGDLNEATATGLSSGAYSVMVSDALGCSASLSITIESVDGPSSIVATELIATSCGESNGAITLVVEGGVTPYNYDWSHDEDLNSNLAEGLFSGIYQVVVTDANGCSLSQTFNVGQSNALTIAEATVMGANCDATDGSIQLTVTNAIGDLTYVWSHDNDLNAASATGLTAGNYGVTITDASGCSVEDMIMVNTVDNPATFVIAATPSNCTDGQGEVTVTITDGRGPYTFIWSHDTDLNAATASNLPAGTYSVLVTDTVGCSVRLETTVDLFLAPSLEATLMSPTCAGAANGEILLTPVGGTPPFTYLWSNGADTSALTSLAAGNYQVTITDANGCTATLDTLLEDGPAIVISLVDSVAPSCGSLTDGRLEIVVDGGTDPFTISWSDGQTGTAAVDLAGGQTYTVTVLSTEGCSAEATFSLPEADAFVLPFPADTSICRDDIWTLDLTEYTNTSVTSDGGFSSNDPVVLLEEAGIYTVTATSASGCTASSAVTVNVTGESFVAGFVLPSDVVVGDSVIVLETSWPAPDNLEWIFDQAGATQVDQRQNQYWFIFDEAGEYSLSLLAGFGGCDDLLTKNITVHPDSTSIPSTGLFRTGISDVLISPNPNDGNFNATVELTNADRIFMNLYEMDGTLVDRREDQGGTDYTFNYNLNLEAGSYLLLVQTPTARRTVVVVVF